MITFVVNLHNGIPGMALAEPFLYPLQEDKKIHLIFPTTDSLHRRIEGAAREVREYLERQPYMKWQAVFLLKIAPDQYSPYYDSIAAQMELIRQLFVTQQLANSKPQNTFLVLIDHVNQDEAIPAINVSEVYRDSWELDTMGFVRNPNRFFVTQTQINELDTIWRRYVNIDSSTIINVGFDRLDASVKEKVKNAVIEIRNEIDTLLHPNNIKFSDYEIDGHVPLISEQTIAAIKIEFLKRLETTIKDPSRYNAFSPANTLKSSIAEQLGIFSIQNENTFRLLRFPVQYTHEDILQRYLIKLSLLLTLLADDEAVVKNLAKKNYTVDIQLKDAEVQQMAYDYMAQLHNAETRFKNRLHNPQPAFIQVLEHNDCHCSETLDKPEPSRLEVGFMRTNGDLPRWSEWNKQHQFLLSSHSEQARKKMQICISRSNKSQGETVQKEEANIDDLTERLFKEKKALQDDVEHNFLTKAFSFSWEDYQKEKEAALKPLLFSRPSMGELGWMIAVSTGIIMIPFVNGYYAGEEAGAHLGYYVLMLMVAVLACFVAFWLAKRYYQRKVKKIMDEVYMKAREVRMGISDEFERQKAYLAALCKLNVVRNNYEAAKKAQIAKNEMNLLLDFHRRKLADHKSMARKILKIFKANEQKMSARFDDELPEPDLTHPIQQNPIYTPMTFVADRRLQDADIAKIENSKYAIQSPLKHLIKYIQFDRDKIYAKDVRV